MLGFDEPSSCKAGALFLSYASHPAFPSLFAGHLFVSVSHVLVMLYYLVIRCYAQLSLLVVLETMVLGELLHSLAVYSSVLELARLKQCLVNKVGYLRQGTILRSILLLNLFFSKGLLPFLMSNLGLNLLFMNAASAALCPTNNASVHLGSFLTLILQTISEGNPLLCS